MFKTTPGDAQPRWYAARTRSRFEKKAAAELAARGVAAWLPLVPETHQWSDRSKLVRMPLFPGYVFVHIADTPAARVSVISTTGVCQILGIAGRIEPIPDVEIDSIRRVVESQTRCFPHPYLREGTRVRVNSGALQGVEGTLVRVKNETRLVLAITMLSQAVAAEIDIDWVEAA